MRLQLLVCLPVVIALLPASPADVPPRNLTCVLSSHCKDDEVCRFEVSRARGRCTKISGSVYAAEKADLRDRTLAAKKARGAKTEEIEERAAQTRRHAKPHDAAPEKSSAEAKPQLSHDDLQAFHDLIAEFMAARAAKTVKKTQFFRAPEEGAPHLQAHHETQKAAYYPATLRMGGQCPGNPKMADRATQTSKEHFVVKPRRYEKPEKEARADEEQASAKIAALSSQRAVPVALQGGAQRAQLSLAADLAENVPSSLANYKRVRRAVPEYETLETELSFVNPMDAPDPAASDELSETDEPASTSTKIATTNQPPTNATEESRPKAKLMPKKIANATIRKAEKEAVLDTILEQPKEQTTEKNSSENAKNAEPPKHELPTHDHIANDAEFAKHIAHISDYLNAITKKSRKKWFLIIESEKSADDSSLLLDLATNSTSLQSILSVVHSKARPADERSAQVTQMPFVLMQNYESLQPNATQPPQPPVDVAAKLSPRNCTHRKDRLKAMLRSLDESPPRRRRRSTTNDDDVDDDSYDSTEGTTTAAAGVDDASSMRPKHNQTTTTTTTTTTTKPTDDTSSDDDDDDNEDEAKAAPTLPPETMTTTTKSAVQKMHARGKGSVRSRPPIRAMLKSATLTLRSADVGMDTDEAVVRRLEERNRRRAARRHRHPPPHRHQHHQHSVRAEKLVHDPKQTNTSDGAQQAADRTGEGEPQVFVIFN